MNFLTSGRQNDYCILCLCAVSESGNSAIVSGVTGEYVASGKFK